MTAGMESKETAVGWATAAATVSKQGVPEGCTHRQAALEDPRTGDLLIVDGVPSTPQNVNNLRVDFLVSYEPTPGTVAFFGYGSSLDSDRTFGIGDLQRSCDGFFVKLAYQFRR
jgi:hypothetical protein